MFRGTESPLRNCKDGDLDWVIVRENSEGEYAGQGGRSHAGKPWEVATEVSIFSRHGVERIMRFAFETAQKRPRKLLTVVTKSNAQRNGMVLWDEVAKAVAVDFPDVTVDKMLVDAMTTRMVLKPESLDTIVATNLVSTSPKILNTCLLTNLSTPISFPILLLRWLVLLVSLLLLTWTPLVSTLVCLSLFTALLLTSLAWVSLTPWLLSGLLLRCSHGWARRRHRRSYWNVLRMSVSREF